MVAQYVLAQEGREFEILRLDESALALELGFMLQPPDAERGRPPLKGFIDQVLYFPRTDEIIVRDLKAGSHVPVDRLQLQVYRLAVESCFGVTARRWWGDYWDARKGIATQGWDLTDRSRAEAAVWFRADIMDTAETLGLYAPNPGHNCSACGVRPHCPAMSDEPFARWTAPDRLALDAPSTGE